MRKKENVRTDITIGGTTFENVDLDKVKSRIGHNRPPRPSGIAVDQLRGIVERIERLEEEKAGIASDVKDVYAEAKGNGYCTKTLRKIIHLRKQDAADREEQEHLLETYKRALGLSLEVEE